MKFMLNHRCTIERAEIVNDDGHQHKKWSPCRKNVRCTLQESSGSIIKLPSGEMVETNGSIFFSGRTDIRPRIGGDTQDRIKMTRPSCGTFLVLFVRDEAGRSHKRGCLEALVKRVGPEETKQPQ